MERPDSVEPTEAASTSEGAPAAASTKEGAAQGAVASPVPAPPVPANAPVQQESATGK